MIRKYLFFFLVFLSSQLSAQEIDREECMKQLQSENLEVDCSLGYKDPEFSAKTMGFVPSISCQISLKFNKIALMSTLTRTSKIEFQEIQTITCELGFGKQEEPIPFRISLNPTAVLTEDFKTQEIDLGIQEISDDIKVFRKKLKERAKEPDVLKKFSDELDKFLESLDSAMTL